MATTNKIRIGGEEREYADTQARSAAQAADGKAEQALTDASEALQEVVALEADLADRIKQLLPSLLPQEEELWKNTASLMSYSSGNLTIPANYKKYIFEYVEQGQSPGVVVRKEFYPIQSGLSYFSITQGDSWDTDGDYYMFLREISTQISGDTLRITINRGYYASLDVDGTGKITRNDGYVIPYRILGVK